MSEKWRKSKVGKEWKKAYQKRWYKTKTGKFYRYRKYRRYFDSHKLQILEIMKNFYDKNKWIVAQFKNRPCTDCQGWYESYQMQFDHRPGEIKLFGISNKRGMKMCRLMKEIKKCDVVCANCHAKRTYERGQHGNKSNSIGPACSNFVPTRASTNKTGMHESRSLSHSK